MPVIVFTAKGSSQMAIEAMQLGAYDYIPKPFDLDERETGTGKELVAERHPPASDRAAGP